MDADKMHAKCFAALPKIAKGTAQPKLMERAEIHLADCEECREELARLRAGGQSKVREVKSERVDVEDNQEERIAIPAGVPPNPPAPIDQPEESASNGPWWVPVLISLLVLETAMLGFVLFQSSQPASTFIRCMVGGA